MTDFGSQKPAKMVPKSNQKETKNRWEKRSEKITEIRPSWGRLGTILGRFGSPLGLKNVDFSCVCHWFSWKSTFLTTNRFKSRLGTNLARSWSIWAPFWAPFWHPKRSKNDVKNMLKKYIDFWSKMDAYDAEIPSPPGAFPPNPLHFRLRLAQQLQSLQASLKALSVIRCLPQPSRCVSPKPPSF